MSVCGQCGKTIWAAEGEPTICPCQRDKVIQDALSFYADSVNYQQTGWQGDPEPSPVERDGGAKARTALNGAFKTAPRATDGGSTLGGIFKKVVSEQNAVKESFVQKYLEVTGARIEDTVLVEERSTDFVSIRYWCEPMKRIED